MERVRIKDIAKMADVSVGTVDRVIQHSNTIKTALKQNIQGNNPVNSFQNIRGFTKLISQIMYM